MNPFNKSHRLVVLLAMALVTSLTPTPTLARPLNLCAAPPPYEGIWVNTNPAATWKQVGLWAGYCAGQGIGRNYLVFVTDTNTLDTANFDKPPYSNQVPQSWGTSFVVRFKSTQANFTVAVVTGGNRYGQLKADWTFAGNNGTDYFTLQPRSSHGLLLPRIGGPYLLSCNSIGEKNDVLTARCQSEAGQWRPATLTKYSGCQGDISNLDGQLICNNAEFPEGSYQQSCAQLSLTAIDLFAICRKVDGTWVNAEMSDWRYCTSGINNDNGQLVCTFGTPPKTESSGSTSSQNKIPAATPVPAPASVPIPWNGDSFPCSRAGIGKSNLCIEQPYPTRRGATAYAVWNIADFTYGEFDRGDGKGFKGPILEQQRVEVPNVTTPRTIRLRWIDTSGRENIDTFTIQLGN